MTKRETDINDALPKRGKGRPPKNGMAMTAAERQKQHRSKIRERLQALESMQSDPGPIDKVPFFELREKMRLKGEVARAAGDVAGDHVAHIRYIAAEAVLYASDLQKTIASGARIAQGNAFQLTRRAVWLEMALRDLEDHIRGIEKEKTRHE